MHRLWALWLDVTGSTSDEVAAWLSAGTALAGLVATGVAYLIRRSVRLERRLESVENVAGDALAEVGHLREELRDRRGRRWYETESAWPHPLDRYGHGE